MFACRNNLIKAGRGIHEEKKRLIAVIATAAPIKSLNIFETSGLMQEHSYYEPFWEVCSYKIPQTFNLNKLNICQLDH